MMSTSPAIETFAGSGPDPPGSPGRRCGRREARLRPGRNPPASASLLSAREERALLRRARSGDLAAQSRLVENNLRLVFAIARRYNCRFLSLEDLVQEGVIGLIEAIRRFDLDRGCHLSTYASHWIRQGISRAVDQQERAIRVPVYASAMVRLVRRVRERLTQALGCEPAAEEISQAADLPVERVRSLLIAIQDPVSLETLVGAEHEELLNQGLAGEPVDPATEVVRAGRIAQLIRLLDQLAPRERAVIEQRFGLGDVPCRTRAELGRQLNLTPSGVRRLEMSALKKIRAAWRVKGGLV